MIRSNDIIRRIGVGFQKERKKERKKKREIERHREREREMKERKNEIGKETPRCTLMATMSTFPFLYCSFDDYIFLKMLGRP